MKSKYISDKNKNIYTDNDFDTFENIDLIENNNIQIRIFIIK